MGIYRMQTVPDKAGVFFDWTFQRQLDSWIKLDYVCLLAVNAIIRMYWVNKMFNLIALVFCLRIQSSFHA